MELAQFINNHLILKNERNLEYYLYIDLIVCNPLELIAQLDGSDLYISEILWWHRVHVGQNSIIGGGGPRDPRNPQEFYFSETFLSREFLIETPKIEYVKYLNTVHMQYPTLDLYPGFDIARRTIEPDANVEGYYRK